MFTLIESAAVERLRDLYLSDDEYTELQQFMMQNAEAGNVVRDPVASGNSAGGAKAAVSAEGCA